MFLRIFPAKLYEGVGGEPTPIRSVEVTLAVGSNQSAIAGITNKKIRFMGLSGIADTATGVSNVYFKNGSGGTNLTNTIVLPINTTPTSMIMPIVDGGYFETTTGTGLFVDVFAQNCRMTVFYIVYTGE